MKGWCWLYICILTRVIIMYRTVYIVDQTSFKPTDFAILMQFIVMQPYPLTKGNKIQAKNKTEPQQCHWLPLSVHLWHLLYDVLNV